MGAATTARAARRVEEVIRVIMKTIERHSGRRARGDEIGAGGWAESADLST